MKHSLDIITCLVFIAILVPLGWWGHKAAEDLVAEALPSEERLHRVGVLKRGAVACLVVAGLLVVALLLITVSQ